MIKNKITSIFSLFFVYLISSFAIAYDGIVNFEGEAVQSTCMFEGISLAGGTPSINPTIQLPDISADALTGGQLAGDTALWLHFRDCIAMTGHQQVYATFYTDNISSDGNLYMPNDTPGSAKNVGLQITAHNTSGYSYAKIPGRVQTTSAVFPQHKSDLLVTDLYSVAYKKVPGSGAVVPGKISATVTYSLTYY
ncbi:fimbrial protein [Entomohabitans teleogrylli]|uniref:fimbrial protein n=1 Tax=Entomohabitans teleogrylli TaxID=1384589 RepID=UPI00073D307E|nr:fimbrial protein [Entomohabitans teleogrylli]